MLYEIIPNKTYKTRKNVITAVNKIIPPGHAASHIRYFIHQTEEGRFFPVFIGVETIHYGIQFHFNVIG